MTDGFDGLVVGIPFISQATASDWSTASTLLGATVRSVLRQPDAGLDVRVIVAGHEPPPIDELSDARVTFESIEEAAPSPEDRAAQMTDKWFKCLTIGTRLGELGGGALMVLDSDDLVSDRLLRYLAANPAPHGHLVVNGYTHDERSGRFYDVNAIIGTPFHQYCGSCAIVRYSAADLPLPGERLPPYPERYFYAFGGHPTIEQTAIDAGRPLTPIPFHAVVKRDNHGVNWTGAAIFGGRRRPLARIVQGRQARAARLTSAEEERVRAEFGLP